jgi:host factor-I protein
VLNASCPIFTIVTVPAPVLRLEKVHVSIRNHSRQVVAPGKRAEGGLMKDAVDSFPASESEGFANRKLIRPAMNRTEHNHSPHNSAPQNAGERRERPERGGHDRANGGGKKAAPPEQTNAENFYYQKQMQSKTPMVIVLRDGEQIHGVIEWYDKSCIKVIRNGGANLLIYKPAIKYMFKEGEDGAK